MTNADKGRVGALARVELGSFDLKAGNTRTRSRASSRSRCSTKAAIVAEAHFLAAGELEALERLEKARARYSELVTRHPDSPFAARAKERLDALGR